MNKNIKLTITGELYSGKSTLAKNLAKHFKLEQFSVGAIQRENAEKMGMTILEYNAYIKEHNLDYEIDNKTKLIGETRTNFIFDARMAWHFIPDSIKVYLSVDIKEAVNRALRDCTRGSECYANKLQAQQGIEKRQMRERKTFMELYGVDKQNKGNYDIVIDTTVASEEEVLEKAVAEIERFIEFREKVTKIAINN